MTGYRINRIFPSLRRAPLPSGRLKLAYGESEGIIVGL